MYLLAARIAALPEVWEQVMAMYVTCKRGYINLINEKKYYLKCGSRSWPCTYFMSRYNVTLGTHPYHTRTTPVQHPYHTRHT